MINEKSAQGIKGYILYSPFKQSGGGYFFRIYRDDGHFTDYDIRSEEIEVELKGDWISLYESEDGENYLDWSSKALGRQRKNS